MTNQMELGDYLAIPHIETAALIALASKLLVSAPKPVNDLLKRPLKRLRSALDDLRAAHAEQGATSTPDRRAADGALDVAWGALYRRLSAAGELPPQLYSVATEATDLLDRLFPSGLTFLTYAYDVEWTESDQRLRRIEAEELQGAIDRTAGAPFLAEVRRTHAQYGLALGITKAVDKSPVRSLSVPYEAMHAAIRAYARRLIGLIEEDDDENTQNTLASLAPIADLKAAVAAQRRPSRQPPDPTIPPPVVTPPVVPPAADPSPTPDVLPTS